MPKSVRALLACLAVMLAASVTISATPKLKSGGANPAFVVFTLAPQKIVCLDEKAPIAIDYSWEEDSGLVRLAPLYPVKPKHSTQTPVPPGKLTLKGDLSGELFTIGVGYEGQLQTEYKAKAAGKEKLTATLTYSSYSDQDSRPFEVKKCDYNLVIKAWNDVNEGGTVITAYFSAEGKISIDENGVVTGELREDAWFDISSDNPILVCELVPLPMAAGSLTVSGTKQSSDAGQPNVHIDLRYGTVKGFPDNVKLACTDKFTGKPVKTSDHPLPPSDKPGNDLLSSLDFPGSGQLTGSFGKGGVSYYILEKLQ